MNGGYGNYPCRCGDLRLAIRGDEIDDPLHFGAPRGGKAFLISMSAPNAVLKSRTILLIKAFKPTLGSWGCSHVVLRVASVRCALPIGGNLAGLVRRYHIAVAPRLCAMRARRS